MSVQIQKVAKIKTEILKFSSDFFIEQGFKWLLPKILTPVTDPLWPDPQAHEVEPVEVHIKTYNTKFKLMHSMILHKQVAIAKGIDKLFILSPNIRIEKRQPDKWHLFEFTQLDFEAKEWTQHHVMHLLENYLTSLTEHLDKLNLIDKHEKPYRYFRKEQFKSYDYRKVLDKYGNETELLIKEKKPFFLTNIPREFYDYEDPHTMMWKNYDLYVPPWGEIASGGEREWEYSKIVEKMKRSGLNIENFKPYLEYARKGMLKPSAGAGIGIERTATIFLNEDNIEKAQIFPRVPFKPVEM